MERRATHVFAADEDQEAVKEADNDEEFLGLGVQFSLKFGKQKFKKEVKEDDSIKK